MPEKTSELDAVNTILSTIGEPPINSLTGQQNQDAAIARNILSEISREVQSQGWHFNTLHNISLSPDSNKHIILSNEVVRVDNDTSIPRDGSVSAVNESRSVIQRGNKLFDKTNNTFEFSTSIRLTLVYLYPFEELPEPARRYVNIKAARVFQDRLVGSQKGNMFTMQDEMRALSILKEYEGDTADHSIFDNQDVLSIVNRRSGIRGAGY